MSESFTSKRMIEAHSKGEINQFPIVSIIEKASTDEHDQESSRADTSKALPRKPASWFGRRYQASIGFVGPNRSTAPYEATVLLHLALLIGFTALLSLAARFPVRAARIAFMCISSFGFILLLGTFFLDLALQRK